MLCVAMSTSVKTYQWPLIANQSPYPMSMWNNWINLVGREIFLPFVVLRVVENSHNVGGGEASMLSCFDDE